MTDLTPVAIQSPVPQLEVNTIALGGTGSPMNLQAQALLNRNAFQSERVDVVVSTVEAIQEFNLEVEGRLDDLPKTIMDFGAVGDGVADDSRPARDMLAALGRLVVPEAKTCVMKNIELPDRPTVRVFGAVKMPAGCSDFDRIFYGSGLTGVDIEIKEIDGNSANQAGPIGTHFVYLTNCDRSRVVVGYARNHYYPTDAPSPSVDGIRDASSGPIFLYRDSNAYAEVGYFENWGRECLQLRECESSSCHVGHMKGQDGGGEYSGVQVSGYWNEIERASVDNAGASAVGFDTIDGICANIIATNTRENHGVNGGHTGFPCSGSIFSNIVVDGCMLNGISIGAASEDVLIDGFSIKNAGEAGINVSDSAQRVRLTTGVIQHSGLCNISVSATEVNARNVSYSVLDQRMVIATVSSGMFEPGETVTSGATTGTVRRVIKDRDATTQKLFLSSASGAFANGSAITGGTSGAVGVVASSTTPVRKIEGAGGVLVTDDDYTVSASGELTRFPDGSSLFRHTVAVVVSSIDTLTASSPVIFPVGAFIAAPKVSVNIAAVNSTQNFTLGQLSASRTSASATININASVAQSYSVDILAVGRWR